MDSNINLNNEEKVKNNKSVLWIAMAIIIICLLAVGIILLLNNKPNNKANDNEINTKDIDKAECTPEETDKDTKNIGEFVWDSVKISMNGKDYSFPMKVSDLINNGWSAKTQDSQELLNKTTNYITDTFNDPNVIYAGFNIVYLAQDNLTLEVSFDLSQTDTKVVDTDVIAMKVTKTDDKVAANLDFNGLGFGKKLITSEAKRIFGDKNYLITDDTKYNTYKFFHEVNGKTYAIVYDTDMCSNEIKSVAINVEK